MATSQLAQTTLRSVLGAHELDETLMNRDQLNHDIQGILDKQTDAWGIKVANVEIKHVDLDESMIRAIAQQAEAERSRRAKVINAEGEKQAAMMIAEAAKTLASEEQALQVRYLQTLKEIANEKTNTIVFPMPLELVEQMLVGGSFGKYINVEKAVQIGLLPDMPWENFDFLGNTSVKGAYLALIDHRLRERITEIADRMTYVELSADNNFYDAFMSALFLPHTDLSLFPTVADAMKK